MNKLSIGTMREEKGTVIFQKHAFGLLPKFCPKAAFVLTDENVFRLCKEQIERTLPTAYVYTMSAGEASKTPETLLKILEAMAGAELKKNSVLVALGGGVVCDIGGLAASLYMRGIPCIYVPTTLLADVDAAIGGKTAVDFCGVKNLIGTLRQPQTVLVDPAFLATLPRRELICGLGEIVKHAALSAPLFDKLLAREGDLFDLGFLEELIPENIAFKAKIVQSDPTDNGLRNCLNLGHTTAHAIELSESGLSHGQCVLLGIFYEAELAGKYLDCDQEYLACLKELCTRISDVRPKEIDAAFSARLARLDKKNRESGRIALIVPTKKGEYATLGLGYEEYRRALCEIREALP